MAYSASNPPVMEQTTQDLTENLQSVNLELKRFLDERNNKLPRVSPNISAIHEKTDRVEKNQVAKEKEFYSKRGKFIPKGTLYHTHYTTDLEVHYMTGGEHNERTQLIFRKSVFDSDFDYYNTLNRQEVVKLKSTSKPPTEDEYRVGRMTRYFARKTNDTSSPVFEVSEDDFESSPLYNFVSLLWYIRGNKIRVTKLNQREIKVASIEIPNIGKLLPILQYYRSDSVVSAKQSIIDRLGITSEQGEAQQETTTTTQTTTAPKTNTQQSAPTGPPPGVVTGGAGGGSY